MRNLALFLVLLGGWCFSNVEGDIIAPEVNRKVLRRRSLSQTYHVLPFSVEWKIEIDPHVDRQPTMREYAGVSRATSNWYTSDAAEIYGQDLSVSNPLCWVRNAKWKPGVQKYSHTIHLDCQVTLVVVDNENMIDALPSIGAFLLDTSAHSLVSDFIANYLQLSGGSPSVFQYSSDATYASYERGAYQAVPFDIDANEEATLLMEDAAFQNIYVMTFDIDWDFVLYEAQEATDKAYAFIVRSTQSWLTVSIEGFYNHPETFRLRRVSTQLVGAPTWNGDRHSLVVSVMVVWEANVMTGVPSPAELLKDMSSGFDLESFLSDYLATSEEGVLQQVQEVSYGTSFVNPNSGLILEPKDGVGMVVENGRPSVSFNMTLTFGLEEDTNEETVWFGGLSPTEYDWEGLLQATQDFLEIAVEEHYNLTVSNSTAFENLTARWVRTEYRSWEIIRPYRGRLQVTLFFREGSVMLPAAYDYKFLISGIFGSNKERYLSEYVRQTQPESNVFRLAERVSWGF